MLVETLTEFDQNSVVLHLERRIDQQTARRVRWLYVARDGEEVVVRGVAPSYYVKQLALQAIQDLCDVRTDLTVRDDIEVRAVGPSGGTEWW